MSQTDTAVHILQQHHRDLAGKKAHQIGGGNRTEVKLMTERRSVDAVDSTDQVKIVTPPQTDAKVPVIVYGPGQERIVTAIAQALARPCVRRPGFDHVSPKDRGTVVSMTADDAVKSRDTKDSTLTTAIHVRNAALGTSLDDTLPAHCDYEFLYTLSPQLLRDAARFFAFILDEVDDHTDLVAKSRTAFLSTTFPDMRAALPNIDILTVGCDAVEVRVDLLREPSSDGHLAGVPSLSYVGFQIMLLRQRTDLPILFTCRSTYFPNGRFPEDDTQLYYEYLSRAIQWGAEYIDVELWLPEDMRSKLYRQRGNTRIMSAFHDFSGTFKWTTQHAEEIFEKSMQYADIVRMIVLVNDQNANFELEYFRHKMQHVHPNAPPFSAVNMGADGQLSRTLNKVLTPVTHPLLPLIAAPGQMSIAEIHGRLTTMGQLPSKRLYSYSDSRVMSSAFRFYQKCLNELGMPHDIEIIERYQQSLSHFAAACGQEDFGGALMEPGVGLFELAHAGQTFSSLTRSDCPSLSEAARAIGIVDTIVVWPDVLSPPSTPAAGISPANTGNLERPLTLHNAEWRGILKLLTSSHTPSAYLNRTALVLASSFRDVSATLFALKVLGISKIHAVGFVLPSTATNCSPPLETCTSLDRLQELRPVGDTIAPFIVVSALSSEKAQVVAMMIRILGPKPTHEVAAPSAILLDLGSEASKRGLNIDSLARQHGFWPYGPGDVQPFTTAARLKLLLGQNVPPNFVRIAAG